MSSKYRFFYTEFSDCVLFPLAYTVSISAAQNGISDCFGCLLFRNPVCKILINICKSQNGSRRSREYFSIKPSQSSCYFIFLRKYCNHLKIFKGSLTLNPHRNHNSSWLPWILAINCRVDSKQNYLLLVRYVVYNLPFSIKHYCLLWNREFYQKFVGCSKDLDLFVSYSFEKRVEGSPRTITTTIAFSWFFKRFSTCITEKRYTLWCQLRPHIDKQSSLVVQFSRVFSFWREILLLLLVMWLKYIRGLSDQGGRCTKVRRHSFCISLNLHKYTIVMRNRKINLHIKH